jgi:hypothetical protein
MKKVRYAAAAIGITPALGLMVPAANATAAATHPPPKPAKKVSLRHVTGAGTGVFLDCGSSHGKSKKSEFSQWRQTTYWAGSSCIASVVGTLHPFIGGLEMRTRVYSVAGGGKVFQAYAHGQHIGNTVVFTQPVNKHGLETCAAVVNSASPASVVYGAQCVSLH